MFDQEGFEQAKQDYINSSRLCTQVLLNSVRAFVEAMAKVEPSWERLSTYLPEDSVSGEPFVVIHAQLVAVVEQQKRFFEEMFQRLSNAASPDEFAAEMKAILNELQRGH